MASVDLQEKANFTRLSRLLVDKGTEALRITLDTIHPPANLPAVLTANRSSLLTMKPRVINNFQWDLLFPPSGNPPDSKTFDVTLVTILLRNICHLPPPATGWNTMPPDMDNSLQANITRIKLFRNQIYAHVTSTQVDQTTFDDLWQKICQALLHLKVSQKEIDELRICPLGPKEEIYAQKLKEWKLNDDDCKSMLQHLTPLVEETHRGVQQLCSSSSRLNGNQHQTYNFEQMQPWQKLAKHNFRSKIKNKVKLCHPGTRDWLLNKVEHWFTKENESRVLLITAGPGFGKSVLAAKVCQGFRQKGKLAACHFCNFSSSNLKDPIMMLQSLASHMYENVAGFKEKLNDQLNRPHKVHNLADAFQIYLQNPLDELEAEPMLIVIDGLDESATDDKSEIVKLIEDCFPDLPECVKVLITSRPGLSLQRLKDIQRVEIYPVNDENDSDILKYLQFFLPRLSTREALNQLSQPHHSVDTSKRNEDDEDSLHCQSFSFPSLSARDTVLHAIVKKCEGSFLYAFHVQRELSKRENVETMSFKEIMAYLPEGMGSVYQKYFDRFERELEAVMKKKPDLFKILEMLVATRSPLPLSFIARALALDSDCREVRKIIDKVNEAVSCLLYVSDDLVTVFHKSVYDWLLGSGYQYHEYTVKISEGEKQLWLLCEQIFKEIKRAVRLWNKVEQTKEVTHALAHGHTYLLACKMKDSFPWFVDMIIVNVLLSVDYHNLFPLRDLLREVLQNDVAISIPLRQQMSWHYLEILCQFSRTIIFPIKSVLYTYYLERVLDHSPAGCFTDCEKELAKKLLGKRTCFVKRNSIVTKPMKSLLAKVFPTNIVAIDVSSNKKFAAVALQNGVICVLSLPNLVESWQYSTNYDSISCCTFAPDDSFILFGKLQTVLNIAERRELVFFKGSEEKFKSCAFSPNGKKLVTVDASRTVKVWDVFKQSVTCYLDAGVLVDCCSFINAGLFIIADAKIGSEDSYCVWNAISFQRVDQRHVSVSKPNRGVLKGERCNRCFRQETKELIPHKSLKILVTTPGPTVGSFGEIMTLELSKHVAPTGIYDGLDCIFYYDNQALHVIESIHFTTLATWEIYVKSYDPFFALRTSLDIKAIEDELWLYGLDDNLVLFKALPPRKNGSFPLCVTCILWCCFSPDGTRLATCTADGFVNLWKVDTCQVYQRFQPSIEASTAACWWSDNYLFVFNIIENVPSLSKYPVVEILKTTITPGKLVPLCAVVDEFLSFSGIIDFSEGFLSFACGRKELVKVLDVNGTGSPKVILLPESRGMISIAVSAGASVVIGVIDDFIILWKRNEGRSAVYEIVARFPIASFLPFSQDFKFKCCFRNDSTSAVVFIANFDEVSLVFIEVNTGMAKLKTTTKGLQLLEICKIFYTNWAVVLLSSNAIQFLELNTLKLFGGSFELSLGNHSVIRSKLSPTENVLAFPKISCDVEFLQLNIPE